MCTQSTRALPRPLPACPLTRPARPPSLQIARSADPRPKKLHYCGPAVKQLLQMDYREQLKVIGAGVKVLERQDSKVRRRERAGSVGGVAWPLEMCTEGRDS